MTTLCDRLRRHWTSAGVRASGGLTEKDIQAFQRDLGVHFPADFAQYLLRLNGFIPAETDHWGISDSQGFEFLLLDRKCLDEFSRLEFARWPLGLVRYGIDLGNRYNGRIQSLGDGGSSRDRVVAASFAEFINLYLDDSPALYGPAIN